MREVAGGFALMLGEEDRSEKHGEVREPILGSDQIRPAQGLIW